VNGMLFKMASFAYLTVFFNVNPLLKLMAIIFVRCNGYSSLRSAHGVCARGLVSWWVGRNFLRDELIFTVLACLVAWTLYAIYLAVSLGKPPREIFLTLMISLCHC
jgi:ABC-type uncharacterized transport system permease subunit